jgi:hypothetical protein
MAGSMITLAGTVEGKRRPDGSSSGGYPRAHAGCSSSSLAGAAERPASPAHARSRTRADGRAAFSSLSLAAARTPEERLRADDRVPATDGLRLTAVIKPEKR